MPLGRKKPFSGKQKKQQLQAKKDRKHQLGIRDGDIEDNLFRERTTTRATSSSG